MFAAILPSTAGIKSIFAAALLSQSPANAPDGPRPQQSSTGERHHRSATVEIRPWEENPYLFGILALGHSEPEWKPAPRDFQVELPEFRDRETVERGLDEN